MDLEEMVLEVNKEARLMVTVDGQIEVMCLPLDKWRMIRDYARYLVEKKEWDKKSEEAGLKKVCGNLGVAGGE